MSISLWSAGGVIFSWSPHASWPWAASYQSCTTMTRFTGVKQRARHLVAAQGQEVEGLEAKDCNRRQGNIGCSLWLRPNSGKPETDAFCRSSFQQVKQLVWARASCPEEAKAMTQWQSNCEELRTSQTPLAPHLANTLGPDRSYHVAMQTSTTWRSLQVVLVWVATWYDRSGPRVFARCGAKGVCEVRSSSQFDCHCVMAFASSGQEALAHRSRSTSRNELLQNSPVLVFLTKWVWLVVFHRLVKEELQNWHSSSLSISLNFSALVTLVQIRSVLFQVLESDLSRSKGILDFATLSFEGAPEPCNADIPRFQARGLKVIECTK